MTGRWQRCGKKKRGAALKHIPSAHAATAERAQTPGGAERSAMTLTST